MCVILITLFIHKHRKIVTFNNKIKHYDEMICWRREYVSGDTDIKTSTKK